MLHAVQHAYADKAALLANEDIDALITNRREYLNNYLLD